MWYNSVDSTPSSDFCFTQLRSSRNGPIDRNVQMFMFQSIYNLVADFYYIDENIVLWLGQISLILLAIVLFPIAFLSDFVSVQKVVMTSCIMISIGSFLKILATMPLPFSRVGINGLSNPQSKIRRSLVQKSVSTTYDRASDISNSTSNNTSICRATGQFDAEIK